MSRAVAIPKDKTEATLLRAKVRQIMEVFEFTILNRGVDNSLQQLKYTAGYCFRTAGPR